MNKYTKIFMDDHNLEVGEKFRRKGTDAYGVYSNVYCIEGNSEEAL